MEELLNEVIANPADIAPRLVYADWLEERGDPRGEFIRLQCDLADMDELHPSFCEMSHRADQLLQEHKQAWEPPIAEHCRKTIYRCGFIEAISLRARMFIEQGEKFFDAMPIHSVRVTNLLGKGAAVAQEQFMSRAMGLDMSGLSIPERDLHALLMSPHLNHLRELDMSAQPRQLEASDARSLVASPARGSLQKLNLESNSVSRNFFAEFADADFPELQELNIVSPYVRHTLEGIGQLNAPQLKTFHVGNTRRAEDFPEIARLFTRCTIQKFQLSDNDISKRGLRRLADTGLFDTVEDLCIEDCRLGSKDADILFYGRRLAACRKLDLHSNYPRMNETPDNELNRRLTIHEPLADLKELKLSMIAGDELQHVALGCMTQLESLTIMNAVADRMNTIALARSPLSKALKRLVLNNAKFDLPGMKALCQARFDNVLVLDLNANYQQEPVGDAGLGVLIESGAFPNLRELRLNGTSATEQTLHKLAQSGSFVELRRLYFRGNMATDAAVHELMTSENLPNLQLVNLKGTRGMKNRPKLRLAYPDRLTV